MSQTIRRNRGDARNFALRAVESIHRRFESVHENAIDHDDRAPHAAAQIAMLFAVVAEGAERVERHGVLPRVAARRTIQAAVVGAPEAVVVGANVVHTAGIAEGDAIMLINRDRRGGERAVRVSGDEVSRRLRADAEQRCENRTRRNPDSPPRIVRDSGTRSRDRRKRHRTSSPAWPRIDRRRASG